MAHRAIAVTGQQRVPKKLIIPMEFVRMLASLTSGNEEQALCAVSNISGVEIARFKLSSGKNL
jgi:hypothetical protein